MAFLYTDTVAEINFCPRSANGREKPLRRKKLKEENIIYIYVYYSCDELLIQENTIKAHKRELVKATVLFKMVIILNFYRQKWSIVLKLVSLSRKKNIL